MGASCLGVSRCRTPSRGENPRQERPSFPTKIPAGPEGRARAAIYAILDRFPARGWVKAHPEPGETYPDRTVLSLTSAAQAELETRRARIGEEPLPTTVPLMAIMMCLDTGGALPADALGRLIEAEIATRRDLAPG